jgi:glycosyltransferase involved in cell wall biosynthesis
MQARNPALASGEAKGRTRLRIAFVYDALYPYQLGGAERRYWELGQQLKRGHDVHFVSWKHWEGPDRVAADGVTLHGVGRAPKLYGEDGKRTVREAASFAARLPGLLLREGFDVVDCSATPYVPVYACWLATRARRTPMVVTWHEFWGEHWRSYLPHRNGVARAAQHLENRAVSFSDRLVAVSRFTAERMPTRRTVEVVGNGICLDRFARYNGACVDSPDIVSVGRLIDEKRVDVLIEAVDRLRHRFPSLTCTIVGDGPERARLEGLVDRLDVRRHVRFMGSVDEATLVDVLHGASVLALPSVREGFGIAVIEAQACGAVPVVARAPHSAAWMLLEDGVDGLVCNPEADAFADAIGRLLADRESWTRMSGAALASAASRDWSTIAGQMERVYLDLAAGRSPAARRRHPAAVAADEAAHATPLDHQPAVAESRR